MLLFNKDKFFHHHQKANEKKIEIMEKLHINAKTQGWSENSAINKIQNTIYFQFI